ncbi:Aspartate carbamoyltransferase [hydrothermal vent metagenome]|uniref:aspartate carbamoyltransferase n=1 Tax=hydrothermal vent metagenome TaxID=652676 RepID=A0A3B1C9P8_9ZZZZ
MTATEEKTETVRHILSMADLPRDGIMNLLKTANMMKEISEREVKKIPTLRGRTVINCFLEPSTRTRTSFEIAGKRLSADVINISASGSSLTKGESLKDMANNLMAMKPDLMVIRTPNSGAPMQIARWVDCPVVNAGDGRHEHPSQSLLDLMTIKEHKNKLEGLNVAIVGDILNSRVARSNLLAMKALGMNVTICGPATLLPQNAENMADRVTTSLEDAVAGAEVVMMLRIQAERLTGASFPNLREYSRLFCLTPEIMKKTAKDVMVMHPGPINRGVEISPEVADGPWSVILDQVTNGVAVRMAILYLLLGGGLGSEAE